MIWTSRFAKFNGLFAILGLAALPWTTIPQAMDKMAVGSLLLMQLVVSASMLYCAEQKIKGSDIGHKAYPASLASYLLWLLISYRWYTESGLG